MKIKNYTYINAAGSYFSKNTPGNMAFDSLEGLYNYLQPNYPKFYKMDTLSQLGLLLTEEFIKGEKPPSGILIWTKFSSYVADLKHVDNSNQGMSGPANFTYTLPNIVLGEIAIRHQIKGECGVFISEQPNALEMATHAQMYLPQSKEANIWLGWLDAGPERPMGFMCDMVTDSSNIHIFTNEIENVYKGLFL